MKEKDSMLLILGEEGRREVQRALNKKVGSKSSGAVDFTSRFVL
jgi:hypothetical protein